MVSVLTNGCFANHWPRCFDKEKVPGMHTSVVVTDDSLLEKTVKPQELVVVGLVGESLDVSGGLNEFLLYLYFWIV